MKKLKVYIASPYTAGDKTLNVRRQIDVADILMYLGHDPFIPLLCHFQHLVHARSEKDWLEWDLAWLKMCDVLIRIKPFDHNGEEVLSSGADLEEETARKAGIPVYIFHSAEEVKEFIHPS
jgi:hypothetical protein